MGGEGYLFGGYVMAIFRGGSRFVDNKRVAIAAGLNLNYCEL